MIHRRLFFLGLPLLMLSIPLSAPLSAQAVLAEDGLAIRGHDPVAYFTEGRPVRGDAAHAADWRGVTWHFASPENRVAFLNDPAAFAPQYGGYCAWAVAEGYTAPIDPRAWRIVDGRLYLNYSTRIQRRWERDIPGNVTRADANWAELGG